MTVNPFRAVAYAMAMLAILGFLAMLGVLVYVAIVDNWWLQALEVIGFLVLLVVVGICSESWEVWEEEWDAKKRAMSGEGEAL